MDREVDADYTEIENFRRCVVECSKYPPWTLTSYG